MHIIYIYNIIICNHAYIYIREITRRPYSMYVSQYNIICYAHDVVSDIIIITTV